jgi:hypothetical protein
VDRVGALVRRKSDCAHARNPVFDKQGADACQRMKCTFESHLRDAGLLLGLRRSPWVTGVNFGNNDGAFHKIWTCRTY